MTDQWLCLSVSSPVSFQRRSSVVPMSVPASFLRRSCVVPAAILRRSSVVPASFQRRFCVVPASFRCRSGLGGHRPELCGAQFSSPGWLASTSPSRERQTGVRELTI